MSAAPYNANADDGRDDTAAIQRALDDHANANTIIYLPEGTYNVSNTLHWPLGSSGGNRSKRTILQGAGSDLSIIKLADDAPGFNDVTNRKGVINTGAAPAQRFRNAIHNLTVNTGSGNSGAAGIQFIANNQGTVKDVKIKSGDGAGAVGLDLSFTDEIGPAMIRDIHVDGFDVGIKIGYTVNSTTYENITLQNQRTAGIYHSGQFVAMRNIRSNNIVPAINIVSNGMVTLDGACFDVPTGSSPHSAINLSSQAALVARDVYTVGYSKSIQSSSKVVPSGYIDHFVSHQVLQLFDSPKRSLGLEVRPTPELPLPSLDNWISPIEFGGNGDSGDRGDDTAAIQRAIDAAAAEGKTTVYLPNGQWTINGTLQLRGTVERIIGTETRIRGNGTIRISEGTSDTVVIERITEAYGTNIKIDHRANRDLVIRNYSRHTEGGYSNRGGGDLYLEDVVGGEWVFKDINVWARQFNVENQGSKIINDGGNLWILGLKTERGGTVVETVNGGSTEILGALVYATGAPKVEPMFINNESSLSVSIGEANFHSPPRNYNILVEETRDGVTKRLYASDAYVGYGNGSLIPLYVGYVPEPSTLCVLGIGASVVVRSRKQSGKSMRCAKVAVHDIMNVSRACVSRGSVEEVST
ncbi:glycosyl hydrolase family 28-related protein [Mucisphaera sp.]|uniref:glycosyl hydrolase family 28-related protein n=1 Tax=Mucisphaera sp. TaxID=2913024 RepID=UPI003D12A89B